MYYIRFDTVAIERHILADNEHYDFWPRSGALAQPFERHNFYALHIVYSTSALKKKEKKSYIGLTTYIFLIVFVSRFFLFLKSVHLLNKSNEQ